MTDQDYADAEDLREFIDRGCSRAFAGLARQTSLEFLKDQRDLNGWFLVREK